MVNGEWGRKGATIGDKAAKAEYGLTEEEVIAGISSGKLDYREGSMHGNPWLRLLRRQVEELARDLHGDRTVEMTTARAELKRLDRELKALRAQVSQLEVRRAEVANSIEALSRA